MGILTGGALLLVARAGLFDSLGTLPNVAVTSFVFASLIWGVLNWIPIRPLDGGQMTFTLFEIVTPKAAEALSRVVSVATGGVAVFVTIRFGDYFAAVFVAFIVLVGLRAPVRPGSGGLIQKSPDTPASRPVGLSGSDASVGEELSVEPEDATVIASPADSYAPVSCLSSDRPVKRSRVRTAIWMTAALLGMFTVIGLVFAFVVLMSPNTGFDLAIGSCFNDPGSGEFNVVHTVSCDEPHDNEVFAVESLDTELGLVYPGESAMQEFGLSACLENLGAYVGSGNQDSIIDVGIIAPVPESWADSDRVITCFLHRLDSRKMTESLRSLTVDTTVPEDVLVAAASTTTVLADATNDTEPADVTIKVEFDVGSEGLFTTDPSGPICLGGSMTDEPGPGEQSGEQVILEAINVFTCEDGSGTFTAKLFVILYPDFTATFDWIVIDGTGDYTRLRGHGEGVGTPIDFPRKLGVFTGEMHIG